GGSGDRAGDRASRRVPRPPLAVPHVPPGTDAERAVAAEWEAVLGVDGIGLDDNFFDLGGDSMRAVLLGGRLRTAGVLDVPAAALLATPTIAGLLDRAGRGGAVGQEAFAPMLPMRAAGDLPPLFCVHPVSGVAWRYTGLLPHLDPRRPVYGLQALGLDGALPAADRAEDVIRDGLERIRAVQPHGPYHLLGWSFGGAVAHRLAAALEAAGEEVALLTMLDTPQPDAAALEGEAVEAQAAALVLRLAGLTMPAPATVDASLALLDSSRRDPEAVPGTLTREEAITVAKVVRNNLRIAPDLVPERLRADVLFISATEVADDEPEVAGGIADRAASWRPFTTGVFEEVPLACSHYALTDPGPIEVIAKAVEARLAGAGGGERAEVAAG
ncbi:alpha/beta fold hydrolase, partial [Streptomyces huiliensis]|uniref:alpha/beta fold hydrolase n=1 Tax=Streptomyces huiliensis TaxID=2876027 RepID=UPI001CBE95A9